MRTFPNLKDVDLLPLSIYERVSILYTLGIIVGIFLHTPFLGFLVLIFTLFLAFRDYTFAFFFCGWFVYSTNIMVIGDFQIPTAITEINRRFVDYINSLPYDTHTLTAALLQGDKSGLTKETIGIFRDAGAAHLLALSGLHMGILYLIFTIFLPKKASFIRYIIIVPVALFFTLMVGAKPSIVRAFLFILIRETSIIANWKLTLIQTLCIALVVQLTITPTVITSVGFQLSYCSVLGIALFYPFLESCFEGEGPLKKVWQYLSISISCQLATSPLSYYYFHSFPLYFLLANLVAVPVTSIFMYLSIAVIILSACRMCPEFMYTAIDFIGNNLLNFLRIISLL